MPAFFTDNLAGQPAGTITGTVSNLLIFLQFFLTFDLKATKHTAAGNTMAELNDLKLKIKAIEKSEKQLLDTMLAGGFNDDYHF